MNVIYHPEYGHSMSNLIIQNILVDRLFNVYVHSFLSSKIHVARIWQLWSQILNQQNYYKWKTVREDMISLLCSSLFCLLDHSL
ncbi:uncharacterized protein LOC131227688 isoform X2 [Magnolia sinica]|uniref:uncharacterized protein LOC131227688 isoform X2 n=1 Tax=Magnolia sinica TaxID=86752 RepID=UPI002657D17A|nr:uncharacterized protein LOC131227688 isoform X2 [Magnolia sinica]